jgi:hypothetical protein
MHTEAKYIAKTGDGDRVAVGSKRSPFDPFRLITKNDLIDLF